MSVHTVLEAEVEELVWKRIRIHQLKTTFDLAQHYKHRCRQMPESSNPTEQ
jgi:hypothetical protein